MLLGKGRGQAEAELSSRGVGAGRLGWAALPILCVGNFGQNWEGSCPMEGGAGGSRSHASQERDKLTDPAAP